MGERREGGGQNSRGLGLGREGETWGLNFAGSFVFVWVFGWGLVGCGVCSSSGGFGKDRQCGFHREHSVFKG